MNVRCYDDLCITLLKVLRSVHLWTDRAKVPCCICTAKLSSMSSCLDLWDTDMPGHEDLSFDVLTVALRRVSCHSLSHEDLSDVVPNCGPKRLLVFSQFILALNLNAFILDQRWF
jgi:hypothetical protein